jgi:YidC/Oxa1 family membrane protein insertase
MMDGGALWFTDLTVADPTYALPIVSSLMFLATVELGAADGMQGQPPETLRKMKMAMRALAVIIVPVTMSMPAVSGSAGSAIAVTPVMLPCSDVACYRSNR